MNLTASDRKALIRLASELPKGSDERKAILSGLNGSEVRVASWDTTQEARKEMSKSAEWLYQKLSRTVKADYGGWGAIDAAKIAKARSKNGVSPSESMFRPNKAGVGPIFAIQNWVWRGRGRGGPHYGYTVAIYDEDKGKVMRNAGYAMSSLSWGGLEDWGSGNIKVRAKNGNYEKMFPESAWSGAARWVYSKVQTEILTTMTHRPENWQERAYGPLS
jgi:hypothetical protein